MNPTPLQLEIIESCNKDYDGAFYYGVKSTRIFCKPSCKSRMPRAENIVIFETVESMVRHGYIPCKRCRPTDRKLPNEAWIDQVVYYIDHNLTKKLTLDEIADECHGSPFHLHRTFKAIKACTIREYVLEKRLEAAVNLLSGSNIPIKAVGEAVGIKNASQFSRDFKMRFGVTPREMRNTAHANN